MLQLLKHKVGVQTHGMVVPSKGRLKQLLDLLVVAPAIRRAEAVVAISESEQQILQDGFGASNVALIPNGVETPEPRHNQRTAQRAQILFLGRLHPRKQPQLFAQIAIEMINAGVNADFRMVGPDEGMLAELTAIRRQAVEPARLAITGPAKPAEVGAIYEDSSIYVHSAKDEPLGMTILEAMSHGLPVVILQSCQLAPFVTETHSGLAVADGDDIGLRDAIERLINDKSLRDTLGANGRSAVAREYSLEVMRTRLAGVYA